MKTLIKLLLMFFLPIVLCSNLSSPSYAEGVIIDETNFPDTIFRNYVLNIDRDGDCLLSVQEIANTTEIELCNMGLTSLKGIEFFYNLTYLDCRNNYIKSLDLSYNPLLDSLHCERNQLSSLNINNNTCLTSLYCNSNKLTDLNVSNCSFLNILHCGANNLQQIDVSCNTHLSDFICGNNPLGKIDVSKNEFLVNLGCDNCQLMSLNVKNNTMLTSLSCNCNQLTNLDLTINTKLSSLKCSANKLSSLSIIPNTNLTILDCSGNQLINIDLYNNTALTTLNCYSNQLQTLNITNCKKLCHLECSSNHIKSLNISNCSILLSLVVNTEPHYEYDQVRYGGGKMGYTSSDNILITDQDVILITVQAPDLTFPSTLSVIETEAFVGSAFTYVKLSDQTTFIGSRAFANCPNLKYIYIPSVTTSIAADAFDKVINLTILGASGSSAETYAAAHGYSFIVTS